MQDMYVCVDTFDSLFWIRMVVGLSGASVHVAVHRERRISVRPATFTFGIIGLFWGKTRKDKQMGEGVVFGAQLRGMSECENSVCVWVCIADLGLGAFTFCRLGGVGCCMFYVRRILS